MLIAIDVSELKRLEKQIDRMPAQIALAIARGLNEGGDKVRTGVQRALQKQTSLVKYASVTSRTRTIRAFPSMADGANYRIVVKRKPPTKPAEFKYWVKRGRGGGVTIRMWEKNIKFERSFQIKGFSGASGLRERKTKKRLPIRPFAGPNLAEEAVRGDAEAAFFEGAATLIIPAIEKHIAKLLLK